MQNALAALAALTALKIFSMFYQSQIFELCVFLLICVKFDMGVTLGKEQHWVSLKWLHLFLDRLNFPSKAVQWQIFSTVRLCFSSNFD